MPVSAKGQADSRRKGNEKGREKERESKRKGTEGHQAYCELTPLISIEKWSL